MKIDSLEFKTIEKQIKTSFQKFCTLELISSNDKPQLRYKNIKNYPYLKGINENTEFCEFKPNLPIEKGLYIWTVDKEIIYIGEAVNLRSRFNSGYGKISPRNCFKGGQSTNVKMNRVAKNIYEDGKSIDIYIYKTSYHKKLEYELLKRIKTKHNIKDN